VEKPSGKTTPSPTTLKRWRQDKQEAEKKEKRKGTHHWSTPTPLCEPPMPPEKCRVCALVVLDHFAVFDITNINAKPASGDKNHDKVVRAGS